MTTSILSHSPAQSLRQYFKNIATAGSAFAEALFAAQGSQFAGHEARTVKPVSQRAKAEGRRQLFALASQYDHLAPSLSAELRAIAAGD